MYLFARTRTCAPDRILEAAGLAADIAAKVTSITGLELRAWNVEFGAPITTFSWTTTVRSHAELGAAREKLAADPGYLETVAAGAELFVGPPEDLLADMVATVGDKGHQGDYASLISATCATGKIAEAMVWSVEMLNHVGSITGRDGVFTRTMYGPWAGVAWISLANSLEEIDAANDAIAADPAYLGKVDGSDGLFLPGSGESRLSRRIA